jgi:TonB-linked SusC/RagA family outer membrane protein
MGSTSSYRVALAVALGLASALARPPAAAAQQARGTVSGTVTSATTSQPLAGVQVFVDGTGRGTTTDERGAYRISGVPAGPHTVRASMLGYSAAQQAVTVAAGGDRTANFVLSQSAVSLDPVVVVGYGTTDRRKLTTAVSSVSSEEIARTPVASVDAAIQGRAPGVQVVQNAGNPGNGITMRIRGAASLSASNQPLFVVDGVPMLQEEYSQFDLGGQNTSGVSGLNPDEIESIDILKDAAAASIYGSRGSNGVVIITTKRGRAGAPHVTFNAYAGIQDLPRQVDVLSGPEYVEYMSESATNDGYEPFGDGGPFDGLTPEEVSRFDTDWQSQVFRNAPISDVNLAVTGGIDRIRYYVTGSSFDQQGIALGSGYTRQAGRMNLDFDASSRLHLKSSLGVSRENTKRIENDNTIDGVVTNAIALNPWLPVRQGGDPNADFTSPVDGLAYSNPVALGTLNNAFTRTLRGMGNVEAEYDFSSVVSLTGRAGMDVLNARDLRWESPKVLGTYAQSAGGVGRMGNTTASRYVAETYLGIDHDLLANPLSLTLGSSVEFNDREYDYLRGEGFPSDAFRYVGNAGKITSYDGGDAGTRLVSFFARATYSIADRYFLSGSMRADGSSRFGTNNRYGYFPAVALGWQLDQEPVLRGLQSLGQFKLRASYGVTGNQQLPNGNEFAYLGRFGRANYGDVPGIAQTSISNPDLKWESTKEYDVGLDAGLVGGRVNFTADYYTKNTDNLLVERPITATSGLTTTWANVGSIRNTGVEFSLNTINVQPRSRSGFGWNTTLNFSTNRNRITSLYNDQPFSTGLYDLNRVEVGHPLGAFYTLQFDSVNSQTGDAVYHDVTGDGEITSADRTFVGNPNPKYWGGIDNTFSWGGFELNGFVQFVQGVSIFNAIRKFADDGGYYPDNKFANVLDRWQKPGDKTDQPRASWNGDSGALDMSSRFVEDGAYWRLQKLSLSYGLPATVARIARLSNARIFVQGNNLHTWTEYSGYNPDVNSNGSSANTALGTDFYAYPLARSVSVGISGTW